MCVKIWDKPYTFDEAVFRLQVVNLVFCEHRIEKCDLFNMMESIDQPDAYKKFKIPLASYR